MRLPQSLLSKKYNKTSSATGVCRDEVKENLNETLENKFRE